MWRPLHTLALSLLVVLCLAAHLHAQSVDIAFTIENAPGSFSREQLDAALPDNYIDAGYSEDMQTLRVDACQAGFYCPPGTTLGAVACPPGTYLSDTAAYSADQCIQCPARKYCPGPNATAFVTCPAGTFCPSMGLAAPKLCPQGQYGTTEGSTACTTCAGGIACANTGMTAPGTPCTAGFYAPPGSGICQACPEGHACTGTGASAPTPCAPGTYAAEAGATACQNPAPGYHSPSTTVTLPCSAGYYSEGNAPTTACTPCPAGAYCPSSALSSPTLCAKGYFQDQTTQQACIGCRPGYRCPTTGVSSPQQCPAGTYSAANRPNCTQTPAGYYSAAGASAPTACPTGTYQPHPGATSDNACLACDVAFICPSGSSIQTSCAAGTYSSNGACLSCVGGHYCPAGAAAPIVCPAGTFTDSLSATALTDCIDAPKGTYAGSAGSLTATACNPGYYNDLSGQTSCRPCPAGTKCPITNTADPIVCVAGTYSIASASVKCETTLAGFYAKAGATAASPCQPGYYCVGGVGSGAPVRCPAGTYAAIEMASACITTPPGFYSNAGADAPVPCDKGTYLPTSGGNSSAACIPCGQGYTCPAGSATKNSDPECAPGTYLNSVSQQCTDCPKGAYCPPSSKSPILCPKGTFSDQIKAVACTSAPAGAYVASIGASASVVCPVATYSESKGASVCQNCTAGTFDATSTGRTSPCPLCPVDHYCPNGVTKTQCQAATNTRGNPGATSTLNCACTPGYSCLYKKRISAVVTLNVSLTNWNANAGGIKDSFIAAIAAAAGVLPSQVVLGPVTARVSNRRLLSVPPGERTGHALRRALERISGTGGDEHMVRVRFEVTGVSPAVDVHHALRTSTMWKL
jgi:hypothetical protein